MKKNLLILIISFILFIPMQANANQLKCDGDNKIQGDTFECMLILNEDLINAQFDKLQGTLTATSGITCKYKYYTNDLVTKDTSTDTFMDLEGSPVANVITTIECTVNDNNATNDKAQVFINDFKYHIFNSNTNDQSEILSSDYFTVEYKSDESQKEASAEKPRKKDNPDSRLKSLTDENLDFNFSQFYLEYNLEVLYDVEQLNLKAVPNNSDATVTIDGNQTLQVGDNTIDIYVTSPDGTSVTCYTLYIKRLARGEEIYYSDSDSSLKKLTIKGYTISFDKDTYEYKIHLASNVSSVSVITEATSESSTIDVSNTSDLKNGSVIVVTVTSKDKSSTTTYKIHVTKDAAKKDYSQILIIVGIVLALILIIALFIITNKKKDSNDPLLSLKYKKRKLNKGKKFDSSQVADITNITNQQPTQQVAENSVAQQVPQQTAVQQTAQIPQQNVQQVNSQMNNSQNNVNQ